MTSIFPIVYDIFYFVFLKNELKGNCKWITSHDRPPWVSNELSSASQIKATHNSIILFFSRFKFTSSFDPPTTNKFETINWYG